jgi:hypothetical protein
MERREEIFQQITENIKKIMLGCDMDETYKLKNELKELYVELGYLTYVANLLKSIDDNK